MNILKRTMTLLLATVICFLFACIASRGLTNSFRMAGLIWILISNVAHCCSIMVTLATIAQGALLLIDMVEQR
ncbi:MAG: hypothetical protein IJI83_03170 [Oscillospiraceae bacterium]|nr:hypothetical protein [Oscillospiraceae bacterium]